jgi:putative glutamine amidotransferase
MKHHGHPRRPSIGITPDVSTATPENPLTRYELKTAYAEAILRAGGLPFILPFTDDRACLDGYLDRVSGLLITGGAFDIPPEAYGEAPKEGLGALKPGRTNFEFSLLKAARARQLPVLGVCGGMQLLNVAWGGTLHQDIGRELPNARPHEQTHDRTHPHHPVDVKDGTVLADALGRGQLMVNSTHHQAVKTVGPGLQVSAVSPDGVIEAIECKQEPFVVGVQWHPELLIDTVPPNLGLYRAFVTRARERRH